VTAIRTVAGDELADRYDTVLAHEHLAIDIRCWLDESHEPSRHLRDATVDATTVEDVRQNPFSCLDNLWLHDRELIAAELAALRDQGRTLIVEVTPQNVGRDIDAMADLARASGVDVVFGCGRYIAESRPGDDPDLPAAAYCDEIVEQFRGPGPHPAVIGEIGTGDPIQPVERRALQGAAQAQGQLGVALYVHLHPWARRGHEALDIVERAGGDPGRTVLCHLDPQIPAGLEYHRELLRRGATIAFDLWGDEFPYGDVTMPTDQERLDATVQLIEEGFGAQLVHSHDVCTKTQLHRFGGAGYDHIPRAIAGRMAAAGLDADEVHRQLAGNALALIQGAERNG
jgi:phosphotriesterase-related protein